jgi:hypothetical protein
MFLIMQPVAYLFLLLLSDTLFWNIDCSCKIGLGKLFVNHKIYVQYYSMNASECLTKTKLHKVVQLRAVAMLCGFISHSVLLLAPFLPVVCGHLRFVKVPLAAIHNKH